MCGRSGTRMLRKNRQSGLSATEENLSICPKLSECSRVPGASGAAVLFPEPAGRNLAVLLVERERIEDGGSLCRRSERVQRVGQDAGESELRRAHQ